MRTRGSADDVLVVLQARAARQDSVLTRREVAAEAGGDWLLRRQVRSGAWTPLLRGAWLVDPSRHGLPLQRSWGRSALLTVPGAVLGFGTAALLHGIAGVPRTGVVEVVVDREVQAQRRRLRPHVRRLHEGDVADLDGLAVTSVVRTLADVVPQLQPIDALAVLDSALNLGLVDLERLESARALTDGRRGAATVRTAWAWADGRAQSPVESRSRFRCLEVGLVPDDLQHEVRDGDGHLVAIADMAFTERRDPTALPLLVEVDGREPHSTPKALYGDRWRHNALVALGYDTVRITYRDTCSRLAVPTMIRNAL